MAVTLDRTVEREIFSVECCRYETAAQYVFHKLVNISEVNCMVIIIMYPIDVLA